MRASPLSMTALTPSIDRLIVPSRSIRRKVMAEGRDAARFAIIPNGVDLSRFASPTRCAFRSEFGVPEGAPLLGVVARLEPEKGHRVLIEAMPAILRAAPDTRLAVVGEGSEAESLAARADSLGVADRVLFTGRRDDVAALTADLTLAVLPSSREAQGISILEAMARRKPVVATAVGGIPEVVADGVSGLLVPPEDPSALAHALIRLARSPSLRQRLGDAGYEIVAERFSIDAQVHRIQELYDEELQRAGALAALGRNGTAPDATTPGPPRGRRRAAVEVPRL